MAAVSSQKWNSFYNDPHPMNSNDVLADFNDDEVTSSGKNKVNHWKPWKGRTRCAKDELQKLILTQTDLLYVHTICIIDRNFGRFLAPKDFKSLLFKGFK